MEEFLNEAACLQAGLQLASATHTKKEICDELVRILLLSKIWFLKLLSMFGEGRKASTYTVDELLEVFFRDAAVKLCLCELLESCKHFKGGAKVVDEYLGVFGSDLVFCDSAASMQHAFAFLSLEDCAVCALTCKCFHQQLQSWPESNLTVYTVFGSASQPLGHWKLSGVDCMQYLRAEHEITHESGLGIHPLEKEEIPYAAIEVQQAYAAVLIRNGLKDDYSPWLGSCRRIAASQSVVKLTTPLRVLRLQRLHERSVINAKSNASAQERQINLPDTAWQLLTSTLLKVQPPTGGVMSLDIDGMSLPSVSLLQPLMSTLPALEQLKYHELNYSWSRASDSFFSSHALVDDKVHCITQCCQALQQVSLFACHLITDASVSSLLSLPALEVLVIAFRLGGPGLHKLQSSPADLTDTGVANALSARALAQAKNSPPFAALRTFSIGGACGGIANAVACAVSTPAAGELSGENFGATVKGVEVGAGATSVAPSLAPTSPLAATLEFLNLCQSDVADGGLASIVIHCQSLRLLDLSRCYKLTATGIQRLCEIKSPLHWLGLRSTEVDDTAMEAICKALRSSLRRVLVEGTELTDDFWQDVAEDYLPSQCWDTVSSACYVNRYNSMQEVIDLSKKGARSRAVEQGYDVDTSRVFWWNLLPPPYGAHAPKPIAPAGQPHVHGRGCCQNAAHDGGDGFKTVQFDKELITKYLVPHTMDHPFWANWGLDDCPGYSKVEAPGACALFYVGDPDQGQEEAVLLNVQMVPATSASNTSTASSTASSDEAMPDAVLDLTNAEQMAYEKMSPDERAVFARFGNPAERHHFAFEIGDSERAFVVQLYGSSTASVSPPPPPGVSAAAAPAPSVGTATAAAPTECGLPKGWPVEVNSPRLPCPRCADPQGIRDHEGFSHEENTAIMMNGYNLRCHIGRRRAESGERYLLVEMDWREASTGASRAGGTDERGSSGDGPDDTVQQVELTVTTFAPQATCRKFCFTPKRWAGEESLDAHGLLASPFVNDCSAPVRGLCALAFDYVLTRPEYRSYRDCDAHLNVWDISRCMAPLGWEVDDAESSDQLLTRMFYWLQSFSSGYSIKFHLERLVDGHTGTDEQIDVPAVMRRLEQQGRFTHQIVLQPAQRGIVECDEPTQFFEVEVLGHFR
jgi:hypothetical protein